MRSAALALILAPASVAAAAPIAIPAGTMGDAVLRLGQQTGLAIGFTDARLSALPTPAVRGTMSAEQALARLLKGLPARAEPIAGGWRIVPAAAPAAKPTARRAPTAFRASPAINSADIIVTASKRGVALRRYPATVAAIDGAGLSALQAASGSDAIVSRVSSLGSTALGPGRNKLFIRGVADSGFNGPSEATVGQYLGELRLNYNAPDPNLAPLDLRSIEVLEGPQGMLYGAGSLGGVIQLTPEPPQLGRWGLRLSAGAQASSSGAPSGDMSGVANIPLVGEAAALRVLAYRSIEGGYIDDVGRDLRDVNRTRVAGGRAAVRIEPGGGWSIRIDGVLQFIDTADGQYADKGLPRLTRSSSLDQPFDNDYALAGITIAKSFGSVALRSATALVKQDVHSRYDFTPPGSALRVFDQSNRITLISNETRLERQDAQGAGWVIGINLLHDQERVSRALGPPASPAQILGVDNSVTDGSAFAEAGVHLAPSLVASAGLRVDYDHLVGRLLADPRDRAEEPRRDEISVLPSLALNWTPSPDTTIFLHYEKGFRPGGLSVSGSGSDIAVQRFVGDNIAAIESGARLARLLGGQFDLAGTLSFARWRHIQADLVDMSGLPFTANVGTGSIYGAEASAVYRPAPPLRIELSLFANRSRLEAAAAPFAAADGRALPNVAKLGARAGLGFTLPLRGAWRLSGGGYARYFGQSRLGLAPALAIRQGNYVDTGANLRLGTPRRAITLDATNLLNARGNRFALGDPFDVTAGRQYVPLRPRTIRLGIELGF